MGLWATITSCEIALRGSPYSYGYSIVANGDDSFPEEMFHGVNFLKHDDKLTQLIVKPKSMSPPTARQMGTWFGDGKYLFFFDNHCLVQPDYFERALTQMKEKNIEMLHSTTRFHSGADFCFEYTLQLDKNFWATTMNTHPVDKREPYRIGVGGHGGFAVKRSTWEEVGGYWTGFDGYGGEESYFDLKMWLLGKEVWIDPKMLHWHFAGNRPYFRHGTDNYYRNMMMCANMIGGQKWMYTVYDKFARGFKAASTSSMYDLLIEAESLSRDHANELAAKRVRTLDEQLEWFKQNEIPH